MTELQEKCEAARDQVQASCRKADELRRAWKDMGDASRRANEGWAMARERTAAWEAVAEVERLVCELAAMSHDAAWSVDAMAKALVAESNERQAAIIKEAENA